MTTETETIHEAVRSRYAAAAVEAAEGACCASDTGAIGATLYSPLERDGLPEAAVLASLGCGNPIAVAELREGERVLDLGSGGGIDVLLSAKRVASPASGIVNAVTRPPRTPRTTTNTSRVATERRPLVTRRSTHPTTG